MNAEADRVRLIELERQRADALIQRDAAALDELMRYVLETLQFLQLERSELAVHVHGDAALMTGRQKARMQRADKPDPVDAESWVTQFWVRRQGGWVQSHFHSVRAAQG